MTPQQPEPISDEYEKEAEYIFYNTRTATLYSGVLSNEAFLIAAKEDIEGIKLWLRSFAAKVRERTLDEVENKSFAVQLTGKDYKFLVPYKSIQEICTSLRPSPEQKGGEDA